MELTQELFSAKFTKPILESKVTAYFIANYEIDVVLQIDDSNGWLYPKGTICLLLLCPLPLSPCWPELLVVVHGCCEQGAKRIITY